MTEFKQLKILYDNFEKLETELSKLIENENFDEATLKVNERTDLSKEIYLAQKTVSLTKEQSEEINKLNKEISKRTQTIIEELETSHKELAKELKETNQKVKINSAYSQSEQVNLGNMIDTAE